MGILSSIAGAVAGNAVSALTSKLSGGKTGESASGNYSGWSDAVQNAVEGRFLDSLGQLNYGQSTDLANLLAQRATDYDIDVDAIMREARRQAEMGTGQEYQSLARRAGSDANSLVAAAYNEALLDQEDNLAALRAQLEMQEQQGGMDALAQALDANNQTNNTILNLGSLLKGAQSTETSTGTMKNRQYGLGYNSQQQASQQFGLPTARR